MTDEMMKALQTFERRCNLGEQMAKHAAGLSSDRVDIAAAFVFSAAALLEQELGQATAPAALHSLTSVAIRDVITQPPMGIVKQPKGA